MKPAEFIARVTTHVRDSLPPEWQGFTLRQFGHQCQWHYGRPQLHYEVWVDRRYDHIEIGLHFEADPDTNLRLLDLFDRRLIEIRAEADQPAEAEHWTPSWTRVHHVIPFQTLDAALADEVAIRLASLITVTQPLLEAALLDTRSRERHTVA
jgi:hypothetical protein